MLGVLPFVTEADIAAAIPRVVAHLRGGGLIAYPTETVYGLGSTMEPEAVDRLSALKGRDRGNPFLILVDGLERIAQVGLRLSGPAAALADRFWPGPVTIVIESGSAPVHPSLRGTHGGIAVRHTSHAGICQIIDALGAPITSTSANRSGLPPGSAPAKIVTQWDVAVAGGNLLVLDAGELPPSLPSTVIDCSVAPPRVLRRGAVGIDVLRRTVPDLVGEG
jgi:L-threonylcarbamoyladenylate synthase